MDPKHHSLRRHAAPPIAITVSALLLACGLAALPGCERQAGTETTTKKTTTTPEGGTRTTETTERTTDTPPRR
jgi:hypothetical protein